MIAVIDNYDSFTFNLVQILRTIRDEICVYRNDEMTVLELEEKNPEGIVISPGPGTVSGRRFARPGSPPGCTLRSRNGVCRRLDLD